MKVLVTGAAGFIGFHTVCRLAERGDEVVGFDNINDYYAVELKHARLAELGIVAGAERAFVQSSRWTNYRFVRADLTDKAFLDDLFAMERFDAVVHLAAQAGVRYSIENPYAYIRSNIEGFLNILEACRHCPVDHLVYASSSSVYGLNDRIPYTETDMTDRPVSLYAATKKSNELMAHAYSKLYGIPTTGLRFFTVYGPWGRPDMSPSLFLGAILEGRPIRVFNHGEMFRDFTYIDDIVTGIRAVLDGPPTPNAEGVAASVYNIGNSRPVALLDFIGAIEQASGRTAIKELLPMQPGDVYRTYADTSTLERDFGYRPDTPLQTGISRFCDWYKKYHNLK
ncbi:MAG: NAD-dependent epimerase [Rikenella sp.]|nr:NAD-dependent epimerase [Rikenella sp.]